MAERVVLRLGAVTAVLLGVTTSAFAQAAQPKRVVLSVQDAEIRSMLRSSRTMDAPEGTR